MAIKQDIEEADNNVQAEIKVPLIKETGHGYVLEDQNSKGHQWMVYLTTFVAVCGSFAFGSCVSVLRLLCLSSFLLKKKRSSEIIYAIKSWCCVSFSRLVFLHLFRLPSQKI